VFRANRRPHLKWRVPGILTVLEVHHRMRYSEARLFGGQVWYTQRAKHRSAAIDCWRLVGYRIHCRQYQPDPRE